MSLEPRPVANKLHKRFGDIAKRIRRSVETPATGMTEVRLTFDDEFSPSAAQAFTTDPNAVNNPAARHIFYNQQLYDLLPGAIEAAVEMGLPPLDVGFPLTFARLSEDALKHLFGNLNCLSSSVSEGGTEWLCIQCYVQYALLCHSVTVPTDRRVEAHPGEPQESVAFRQRGLDAVMTSSHAFFLGAALRDLELSLLNKDDALRGKKTKREPRAGGGTRRKVTLPETEARRAEMLRLIKAGQTIANAARLTARTVGGTFESNRALLKPGRRK